VRKPALACRRAILCPATAAICAHRPITYHDAFSTAGFTKLTFYINGGVDGGQSLMIKAMAGGNAIAAEFVIRFKVETRAVVEVQLKDLVAQGKTIESILWQAQGSLYSAYYVARIQFE
jgi:hypothetical protein